LHLGSANHLLQGFENVDFYDVKIAVKKLLGRIDGEIKYVGHDLRFPLPFPSASFEGAFCEHTLEHLHPHHAKKFLKEVRRVLKPGSIFRIVVPDLDLYLDFCSGKVINEKFLKFNTPASAIWSLTQNFGHRSVWNIIQLEEALLEAGFKSVMNLEFKSGSDSRLLHDLQRRSWESLYVECRS
jgi:SAM-dependent methyltransferase